jgi:hypothetical protein
MNEMTSDFKLAPTRWESGLGREIQQSAVRYEPRRQGSRVQAGSRDASRRSHYQLTGTLLGTPVKIMVVFDAIHRAVVSIVEN